MTLSVLHLYFKDFDQTSCGEDKSQNHHANQYLTPIRFMKILNIFFLKTQFIFVRTVSKKIFPKWYCDSFSIYYFGSRCYCGAWEFLLTSETTLQCDLLFNLDLLVARDKFLEEKFWNLHKASGCWCRFIKYSLCKSCTFSNQNLRNTNQNTLNCHSETIFRLYELLTSSFSCLPLFTPTRF